MSRFFGRVLLSIVTTATKQVCKKSLVVNELRRKSQQLSNDERLSRASLGLRLALKLLVTLEHHMFRHIQGTPR